MIRKLISKGVFEGRTATGNETFSLCTRLCATMFVILSVVTRIETISLKIRAHPLPKNGKSPLPVAVKKNVLILVKFSKRIAALINKNTFVGGGGGGRVFKRGRSLEGGR